MPYLLHDVHASYTFYACMLIRAGRKVGGGGQTGSGLGMAGGMDMTFPFFTSPALPHPTIPHIPIPGATAPSPYLPLLPPLLCLHAFSHAPHHPHAFFALFFMPRATFATTRGVCRYTTTRRTPSLIPVPTRFCSPPYRHRAPLTRISRRAFPWLPHSLLSRSWRPYLYYPSLAARHVPVCGWLCRAARAILLVCMPQ